MLIKRRANVPAGGGEGKGRPDRAADLRLAVLLSPRQLGSVVARETTIAVKAGLALKSLSSLDPLD